MSDLLPTMDAILRLRGKLAWDRMTEESRRRANNTMISLAEDVNTQDIIRLMVAYRELTNGLREALKSVDKRIQDPNNAWIPDPVLQEFHNRVNHLLCSSVQMTSAAGGSHGPKDV